MATLTPNTTVTVDNAPTSFSTVSLLQPTAFKVTIDRQYFANLEFFAQSVLHPAMSLTAAEVPYKRIGSVPFPGDKLTFGEVTAIIIIDEDLNAYTEMYNWIDSIVPISNTKNFETYTDTARNKTNVLASIDNDLNQYSDITLVINTNKNIPNRFIRFHDAFPIALSGIELESGADAEPAICTVSFRFTFYEIKTTS